MNQYFPRVITMLRKERGLSQKQVADELGISQALLSHYEKGIRECGLDFVCKTADYYDVSCDYLLGRSPHRGYELSAQSTESTPRRHAGAEQINRGLITNSLDILYSLLGKISNRKLTVNTSSYLFLSIYRLFRRIYGVSAENPQDMYTVDEGVYSGYSAAAMERIYTDIVGQTEVNAENSYLSRYISSTDGTPITDEYPDMSNSLLKIIEQAEGNIHRLHR